MHVSSPLLLRHSTQRSSRAIAVFALFAHWYFREKPVRIVRTYAAYAAALAQVVSPLFLLRTLLMPWKNITDAYPRNAFDLAAVVQTLTLNIVSRLIGAILRSFVLCLGLVLQCVFLLSMVLYLIAWFVFPVLFASGVLFLVYAFVR